jgi:hypothetical protein
MMDTLQGLIRLIVSFRFFDHSFLPAVVMHMLIKFTDGIADCVGAQIYALKSSSVL